METGIYVLSQYNEQIKWNLHLSLLVHDVTLLDLFIEMVSVVNKYFAWWLLRICITVYFKIQLFLNLCNSNFQTSLKRFSDVTAK